MFMAHLARKQEELGEHGCMARGDVGGDSKMPA